MTTLQLDSYSTSKKKFKFPNDLFCVLEPPYPYLEQYVHDQHFSSTRISTRASANIFFVKIVSMPWTYRLLTIIQNSLMHPCQNSSCIWPPSSHTVPTCPSHNFNKLSSVNLYRMGPILKGHGYIFKNQ